MSTLEQGRTAPRARTWTLFAPSDASEIDERAIELILDARLFEQELYRQRAQADRTDSGFVLLSFSVGDAVSNGRSIEGYAEILAGLVRKRARMSDAVGWDGESRLRVGAILPCADPDAIQGFVADVEQTFRERASGHGKSAPQLHCDVYAYPSPGTIEGLSM